MNQSQDDGRSTRTNGTGKYIFFGFLLIAGYFLYTEHRAHVVPYLPFLLLLACPLLHLFHGHGGHGGHGGKAEGDGEQPGADSPSRGDSAPDRPSSPTHRH